jgi:hypothetical protein
MSGPKVFLSYASEDSGVVGALQAAFDNLKEEVTYGLEVFLDAHNIESGKSISETIIKELETSDILFIVYTEALKKSHSYTGQELGTFRFIRYDEKRRLSDTKRRIVTLFFNEAPAGEEDVFGIRLDMSALGNVAEESYDRLDPQRGLLRFFKLLTDMILECYAAGLGPEPASPAAAGQRTEKIAKIRAKWHAYVEGKLVPELLRSLQKQLSSRVASRSIEQKFLKLTWKPGSKRIAGNGDLLCGCELSTEQSGVFELFGLSDQSSMSWEKFTDLLTDEHTSDAPFIINSLRNAVISGLSPGDVDNEQFFRAPTQKLYRIIVTRHYAFYDGSKQMHVYFVPMFSRFERGDISIILALLNVATRYRLAFLDEAHSELVVRQFEVIFRPEQFKKKVRQFVRELLLIDDESHVYGLDKPAEVFKYYEGISALRVTELFTEWYRRKDRLMTLAVEIENAPVSSPNTMSQEMSGLLRRWTSELRDFCAYIEPLNREFGKRAAMRLQSWFDLQNGVAVPPATRPQPELAGSPAIELLAGSD